MLNLCFLLFYNNLNHQQDPKFHHSIESTTIIEVDKDVKVIEFKEDPEILSRKSYKEIVDKDLQEILKRNNMC